MLFLCILSTEDIISCRLLGFGILYLADPHLMSLSQTHPFLLLSSSDPVFLHRTLHVFVMMTSTCSSRVSPPSPVHLLLADGRISSLTQHGTKRNQSYLTKLLREQRSELRLKGLLFNVMNFFSCEGLPRLPNGANQGRFSFFFMGQRLCVYLQLDLSG